MRAAAASNKNLPAAQMPQLAQDEETVRIALATNPSCSADVLKTLAKDDKPEVREAVALNPSTPPDLLTTLGADDDCWIPVTQMLSALRARK